MIHAIPTKGALMVHKAIWTWASLKFQKGHTKVNIKLVWDTNEEKIPTKLQHDTSNSWGVITFTRQFNILVLFESSKRSHIGQYWTVLRFLCAELAMPNTLLSCNMMQAISEKILCWKGVTVWHPLDNELVWKF